MGFMEDGIIDADQNADALTSAPGSTSAGVRGEGADAHAGSHGDTDTSGDSWAEMLAGNTVAAQIEALEEAEGKAGKPEKAREKSAATQQAAKPKPKAGNAEPKEPDDNERVTDPKERPVLPDDDEDEDEPGTDSGEGGEDPEAIAKKAKALEHDNFKTREANRKLKTTLEEKEKRIAELERQAQSGGNSVNDEMPPGFAGARSATDVEKYHAYWQQQLEWAEDHEDTGYVGPNAKGDEVEYTPAQMRTYRRQVERTLKGSETARQVFTKRAERESKAKETVTRKYPFVTNPDSPRQALIAEIEKEHPEISTSPSRLLLVGRLAVAKLIEDGEYEITRKSKPRDPQAPPAPRSTPPPPPPVKRTAPRAPEAEGDDWAMSLARSSLPGAVAQ